MTHSTRQVRLARRPDGLPEDSTWSFTTTPVPALEDGEVLVRVGCLSLAPAMRGWLDDRPSYLPPVAIGDVMRASGTATVLESRCPDLPAGTTVMGLVGVTELAVVRGADLTPIDLSVADEATWLGALGLPGMTAWFGLHDVAAVKPGQTVLVSGAAGAVGSMVVQLAKAQGCRVIGIAGGKDKTTWLTESLGADEAIDYRAGPVLDALRGAAGDGVDIFFDNVGGETLDAGLQMLRRSARVVICGAIATYNDSSPTPGPSHYLSLLVNRASMSGFIVTDYAHRFAEARREIASRLQDGGIITRSHVVDGGVDDFPATLSMLFSGANTGKLVLRLRS
ncbi:NADP-dependent oxidoreductase [Aeromicrobium sp.]|uniref:NADP-dependent oxidoreductase n=1 Tax=Aeromicrobium sp. TaxID=1871063 RepID=UPI0028A649DE|nr:NADP-dependent oxidoreductase [Aeromicrobium sp.]